MRLFFFGTLFAGSFVFFVLTGCSVLNPVPLSVVEDETNTASISFVNENPGVSYVVYNDNLLPEPEDGTYWDLILLPGGLPIDMVVHAYFRQQSHGFGNVGLLGMIIATAVEAAIITSRKEGGLSGTNKLILKDMETKKVFYQQEFLAY